MAAWRGHKRDTHGHEMLTMTPIQYLPAPDDPVRVECSAEEQQGKHADQGGFERGPGQVGLHPLHARGDGQSGGLCGVWDDANLPDPHLANLRAQEHTKEVRTEEDGQADALGGHTPKAGADRQLQLPGRRTAHPEPPRSPSYGDILLGHGELATLATDAVVGTLWRHWTAANGGPERRRGH
jgi:hypothetical protein